MASLPEPVQAAATSGAANVPAGRGERRECCSICVAPRTYPNDDCNYIQGALQANHDGMLEILNRRVDACSRRLVTAISSAWFLDGQTLNLVVLTVVSRGMYHEAETSNV